MLQCWKRVTCLCGTPAQSNIIQFNIPAVNRICVKVMMFRFCSEMLIQLYCNFISFLFYLMEGLKWLYCLKTDGFIGLLMPRLTMM